MPKGVETFNRLENVWVAALRCALPLAKALRHVLIEGAMAKVVTQGKGGKMERLYEYLVGPLFRNRVSAIVEACVSMQDDLEAEKRAWTKHWAEHERRLVGTIPPNIGLALVFLRVFRRVQVHAVAQLGISDTIRRTRVLRPDSVRCEVDTP
jgi:hypothetical protein